MMDNIEKRIVELKKIKDDNVKELNNLQNKRNELMQEVKQFDEAIGRAQGNIFANEVAIGELENLKNEISGDVLGSEKEKQQGSSREKADDV